MFALFLIKYSIMPFMYSKLRIDGFNVAKHVF